MAGLALKFENATLVALPVEPKASNVPRTVPGACFSRVPLQPLDSPQIVAVSEEALDLINISKEQAASQSFLGAFSGNELMPGSEPAAHCYCGYQFGYFSGQLGDGAAMYLGEGIPTTRAGSLITSDTRVVRDVHYTGNNIRERASVVSRLAPTFLRFGSFEICKPVDPVTSRGGPSEKDGHALLPKLLHHTIRAYFPHIWAAHGGERLTAGFTAFFDSGVSAETRSCLQSMYLSFYQEVGPAVARSRLWGVERVGSDTSSARPQSGCMCLSRRPRSSHGAQEARARHCNRRLVCGACRVVLRTASLVAGWQGVGWCHGVLNTDNMSIVGLTIDYGPFGFLDTYNPDHVCNGSDDQGRYTFQAQPSICHWNCEKLGEALKPLLPPGGGKRQLGGYMPEYDRVFGALCRRKLGLLGCEEDGDGALYDSLLQQSGQRNHGEIVAGLASPSDMAAMLAPKIPAANLQMLMMLAGKDPELLHQLGTSMKALQQDIDRMTRSKAFSSTTPSEKSAADTRRWGAWLQRYSQRLARDAAAGSTQRQRTELMNRTNPKFILRNWVLEQAIQAAEGGDFSKVQELLQLAKDPFASGVAVSDSGAGPSQDGACVLTRMALFAGKPPGWAKGLCVTCSS
ncbi:MAG: hypothetical protein WDW38_008907 [Sanguina aurantia]